VEYWYGYLKLGNFQAYLPGRDSPNFTIPITAEFDVQLLRPIWRFWERRISIFYSLAYFDGFNFDDDGNEHPFADHDASAGYSLDFTDDEVDPRKGVRFSYDMTLHAPHESIFGKDKNPGNIIDDSNEITVKHYNLVMYFPFTDRFTLAWDSQYFTAEGQERKGEIVAGGSPPLRGYPEGRWSDRYGVFTAFEGRYTWPKNINLDIYLAHGVMEGIQFAVFYEAGQVNPDPGHALYTELHESYGAGVRALFSAIVVRLEFASSDEGLQTILTIDQPF
jgi:outer membrane protein assembly factor BamA